MKTKKTIVITGTHHTPAIEIIKQLQFDPKYLWEIHYISHLTPQDTHLTNIIIPQLLSHFHHIPCGKFNRRSIIDTLIGIPSIIAGLVKSIILINQLKPDLILSFGGYVSVPVILAGFIFHVPSITHEQTLTISLATRINSLFCTKVALSFDEAIFKKVLPLSKIVITGNPVRRELFKTSSSKFNFLKSIIKTHPLIYITGGNQGSDFINKLIIKTLPLMSKYTVIHQTGKVNFESVKTVTSSLKIRNYYPIEYVNSDNIGWILNNAQIVIGRSGANICLDLHVLNKKAILIPLPFTQQDEQLLNAKWLQAQHPKHIIVAPQSDISPTLLFEHITSLCQYRAKNSKVIPPKTNLLFKLIHETV